MNSQIRNVLARYYEDPQDSLDPTRDNVPFLDYLRKKAPVVDSEQPSGEESGGCLYNPYDYKDPSSAPKNIEDSPEVFVKDIPTHPLFTKGLVFDEDSPMEQWQKARRRDWTEPPRDQMPNISIVRRHASVHSVIARYLHDAMPIIMDETELTEERTKTAATLNEVLNKDFHYKNDEKMQRANQVAVVWENQGKTKETKQGKFIFRTSSPDTAEPYYTIFQFYQAPEKVKGSVRYVDLPVKFSCSCQSFLWYGAQYYAVQEKYMYLPALRRSVMPPTPHTQISRVRRGKGLNFRVCKHILAVYDELQSKSIETEYKELIKVTPLSKIMNPKEFERLLGIPFSYQAIKEQLQKLNPMTPKMKSFFRYKVQGSKKQKLALSKLDRWYFTKFRKMSEPQKVQALEAYIQHPEEIFYLMLRDAVVNNGNISDNFILDGVKLMSNVIDPDYGVRLERGELEAVPGENVSEQEGLENVPQSQKEVGKGTGIATPEAVQQYRKDREEHSDEDESEK